MCVPLFLFSSPYFFPSRRPVLDACARLAICLAWSIGVRVVLRAPVFLVGLRMQSAVLALIPPFVNIVPSPNALVLLFPVVSGPRLFLVRPVLFLLLGGLPRSSQVSLVEPSVPLPSTSGIGAPSSPMSHLLPELSADSGRVELLSKATFWRGEMACHRSMVVTGHWGYDLTAKAYLEVVEKLVAPLPSGKGKEQEGK